MIEDHLTPEEKIKTLEALLSNSSHFNNYLKGLREKNWDVTPIVNTIEQALNKIESGLKSFVIYGEPQCGKTAMMIGLTSKLMETGHNLIILLLNDSVKLLNQNLDRFIISRLRPTPRLATDVCDQGGVLDRQNILFCKKNIKDLKKLHELVGDREKIIIDDEADYASPNAKINKNERTAINDAIFKMINPATVYIGVTATPARLDLNNTFDTDNEEWVYFEPHKDYVGKKEIFFNEVGYQKFSVSSNEQKDLEKAIIAFIINVVYLNALSFHFNQRIENYSFLIHTSGKKLDHQKDAGIVRKILSALADEYHKQHENYLGEMRECLKIPNNKMIQDFGIENIVKYIKQNISSQKIVIMNSNFDNREENTVPPAMFTFYIGGNVVSRGVTFDNLLGMFFTRSTKHNIQQDTYIQRARMLGARKNYIKYFQLWIPDQLFKDWQQCFIYHHLSLESTRATGTAPIWMSGERLIPTASNSIDRRNILTSKGEIASKKFNYSAVVNQVEQILHDEKTPELDRLDKIKEFIPISEIFDVIIEFIKITSGQSKTNVNIIKTRHIQPTTAHHDHLYTDKGLIGGKDYRDINKDHHIMIVTNQKGEGRVIYRYSPHKIRFFTKVGVNSDN